MLEKNRYIRNIIIDKIGIEGQKKLSLAKILVIGAGGLGSSTILYLAANGIGAITIIDHDKVELSNLQRQIIHNQQDINRFKVDSAKEKISHLNSNINLTTLKLKADEKNLKKIITEFDIVIDCSDNFTTRFNINKICYTNNKTLIFGAVKEFYAQLAIFKPSIHSSCYNCFNEDNAQKRLDTKLSDKGILGSIPGIVGSMQATIAINEILSINEFKPNQILLCNFLDFSFRTVKISKNPSCNICNK
jgi:molybdopterin/thiamine biosynthesis adenylyltransferase|tara:strand:- start:5031 stop:5771 length:741 start_codon:yes stop_codon:yes gene_type:complete